MSTLKLIFLLFILFSVEIAHAQGIQLQEVLVVSHPQLNSGTTPDAFQSFVSKDVLPAVNKTPSGTSNSLFKADRGKQKGEFLLAGTTKSTKGNSYAKNPFNIKGYGSLVKNPDSFTEYHLIGADKIQSLPNSGILGIHSIQVKNERAKDFEKFVVEKLHPVVSHLFPDMQLLYYKAVAGADVGSYITVFTIDSPAARDKYWPGGSDETEILKKTFKPLEGLAKELEAYLVPGSFLEPSSGGAAAIWESKVWTDFIHTNYLK